MSDHVNELSGTGGLSWDLRFSTLPSFGPGPAFNVLDFSQGFSFGLRLEKQFGLVGRTNVAVIGEVFNAFNWAHYGCLENFIGPGGNPNLGNPTCVTTLGRRFQAGLRIGF